MKLSTLAMSACLLGVEASVSEKRKSPTLMSRGFKIKDIPTF